MNNKHIEIVLNCVYSNGINTAIKTKINNAELSNFLNTDKEFLQVESNCYRTCIANEDDYNENKSMYAQEFIIPRKSIAYIRNL